jgi:tetratricopeptide (TPR) repeat protein
MPPAVLPILFGAQKRTFWIALLLVLLTLAVFWPATRNAFTGYDDPDYVTRNPHVQAGLTWQGLSWAFGRLHGENTYWHPLTWVSHMVDYQLFGLRPAGHHLVNLLFHALNTVLVFLVFQRMTGAFWRSTVLAILFALHPLQVDTVAWVAERKNLLSAFFWLLTMWAYVRYTEGRRNNAECRMPNLATSIAPPALRYYFFALCFFALGLLCKPVLVTLPFVLLLLDYWPLRRFGPSTRNPQPATSFRLVAEKAPFLLLAGVSSVITILSHRSLMGLVDAAAGLPLEPRIENALVSYARYLGKTVWPSHLAVFYPHPVSWPLAAIIPSGLLLLALSALVIGNLRRRPYLFVGWCWFLGVLVPFIGVIQAGSQAMADRFAYVPLLGLFMALVWGVHDVVARWRYPAFALSAIATAAVLLCLTLTRRQISYWKNDESLFGHALAVTENNAEAHYNLGMTLASRGAFDEAIRHYEEVVRLSPLDPEAHSGLAYALAGKHRLAEAVAQYQEALRLNPGDAVSHYELGNIQAKQGQLQGAIEHYKEALRLRPDFPAAQYGLGLALLSRGSYPEATAQFREVLRVNPSLAGARRKLGQALAAQRQFAEAIEQYRAALRLKPGEVGAHTELGSLLVEHSQLDEAIEQYTRAVQLAPKSAEVQYDLGAALAKKRDWENAARQFGLALELDPNLAAAHYQLGMVYLLQRHMAEALEHWREAARLNPKWPDPLNNLAWVLATDPRSEWRNGAEALRLAVRAGELAGTNDVRLLDTLAAAYAETGRFAEATNAIQKAITLAEGANATNSITEFRRRLDLYQNQKPYHGE